MRVTVFTSNQLRHIALLDGLVAAGHTVQAVIEPKTMLVPLETDVLATYWAKVRHAERQTFLKSPIISCPVMVLRPGELSRLGWLPDLLWHADRFIVFSSSYLTGWLCKQLVENRTLNLHVGLAPEYRGSAPNAFAEYDGNRHLIGAQIQLLSEGLDSGQILAEVKPGPEGDYFTRSMAAVKLGIDAMVEHIALPFETWREFRPNNRAQQIRYSKHSDFTELIAKTILDGKP